jgi:hypothetical protein
MGYWYLPEREIYEAAPIPSQTPKPPSSGNHPNPDSSSSPLGFLVARSPAAATICKNVGWVSEKALCEGAIYTLMVWRRRCSRLLDGERIGRTTLEKGTAEAKE